MVITILSWMWIGISAFLCGYGVLEGLFRRKRGRHYGLDSYLLAGLCVLTVYAQAFSLFYKVGELATAILALACLGILFCFRRSLANYIGQLCKSLKIYQILVVGVVVVCVVILTAQAPTHYDTDLYHAQSIRWIEEYGVVKGLGNIYNRLAYNSAFFSLQALFSLKFLLNRSLHSVNGFIVVLMLCYAVLTLQAFHKKKVVISDLFKAGLLFYLSGASVLAVISSPGSDILTLSMVLYLGAKWSECREEREEDITVYGVLCLLAAWTATIKLSAAMLVLLAIYPAIELIRTKSWKQIALFVSSGVVILLPFLIRNVMISGYLIYPYASIDLFDVDWKMAKSVLVDDKMEIAAWGRGMTRRGQYDAPASVWLPVWFAGLSTGYRILVILNVFCVATAVSFIIGSILCGLRRKKAIDVPQITLYVSSLAGLLLWFASSPLMRYGEIYLLLLPILLLGGTLECWQSRRRMPEVGATETKTPEPKIPKSKIQKLKASGSKTAETKEKKIKTPETKLAGRMIYQGVCVGLFSLLLLIVLVNYVQADRNYGLEPQLMPADYLTRECTTYQMEDLTIYIPVDSDQMGYYNFPGTTNVERAQIAELRSGRLEDGFCLKEEYRDVSIYNDGLLWDREE